MTSTKLHENNTDDANKMSELLQPEKKFNVLETRKNLTQQKKIEKLIGTAPTSYERLPMLEVVFDRFVRRLTTTLRNRITDSVVISIREIFSQRWEEYLQNDAKKSLYVVFKADEWNGSGVLVLESKLFYSLIDSLLGGRKEKNAFLSNRDHYTEIEKALIKPILHEILTSFAESFYPLCKVDFAFERLETNTRFVAVSRPMDGVVRLSFNIQIEENIGKADFILPYAMLEPIRDTLLQQYMGEKLGHDTVWENHLVQELWKTHINIDVVLGEQEIDFNKITNFSPGDKIFLRRLSENFVSVRSGGKDLFTAKMGQRRGGVAISIENSFIE
ncbi:flagellar motor switch protein FliM [Swingsia samuiensis]|uniref:Flagellar motor switch protein FliM n=1 Tax=Swingsia samuiensis TaxID=1293412 RepID=A0A4Y6UHZ1_9PROT|nr:flagellar motor switch protein FliM [Swingsia samuiensis]QDH17132.1 flagellar motor switch protein FliM [Swingsia samuiensis]